MKHSNGKIVSHYRLFPKNTRRNNPTISVKTAEPITDHITGNGFPWTEISKIGGKPNFPAIHMPM